MYSAREFGIEVHKTSGDEEYVLCPFHDDHSTSASFNRTKGLLYCYVCGRGWNIQQLQKDLELELDLSQREPADFNLLQDPQSLQLGSDRYEYHGSYFEARRVSHAVLEAYGVQWLDRPKAAVLPITRYGGEVQGVAHRYIEGPTRYKVFGETTPVWPMHLFKAFPHFERVIVVEGAWSAMRIATIAGFGDLPVALLGAKASQRVVNTLRGFEVVFLYDGDAAGKRACDKMRTLFPTATVHCVSPSPDDMSDGQVRKLLSRI